MDNFEQVTVTRSFFGSPKEIEAVYAATFASDQFAEWHRPGAEEERLKAYAREARRLETPKRVRKPSLRKAMATAKRAGVAVSGAIIKGDGSIELMFGDVNTIDVVKENKPEKINRWDEVLRGPAKIALVKR